MNHYVEGLVVLLVLSAISISGVYATGSGISLNINGCSNSVSQSVPSGSAINQAISSHSAAITGTAQINGPYFFTDIVTNPEGDNAGITVDVVGTTGITTGSHSFTSSITPTVATYASALTVGTPATSDNPLPANGAYFINNYAYGSNAEGDFAEADTMAQDNNNHPEEDITYPTNGAYANMQNSFVMGGATNKGAFGWAQADNIQGDYVEASTDSGQNNLNSFTEAEMGVGDPNGFTAWLISPSIQGYQSFSVMANGQQLLASVLNSGIVDATSTSTRGGQPSDTRGLGGNVNPNAFVTTLAHSERSGGSQDIISLPSGLLSVDNSPISFGYCDNENTYTQLTATASGLSSALAYAQTGANLIPISESGSGFGNTDYNLVAYSGIGDNSANVIVNTV